jgi:hypothetical protein
MSWYLHCYVHADRDGVVPVAEDVLDGIRVGGARNYGFGRLSVADSQVVNLDALDYSQVEAAAKSDADCRIELVTPYVLETEYPGGDAQSIPWWWRIETDDAVGGVTSDGLRRRETRLVDGADAYTVHTVDHGQVVTYAGDDPVETAKNSVLRVGTHSRFGFGELRVRPPGTDRVPERAATVEGDA